MLVDFLLLALGIALLLVGAEGLVRGASRIALGAGISPLVVGLTVVAYGTSAPEAAVSIQGALAGTSDIAIGNVVGSNVFNVLVILGLSAMITPLTVAEQIVRREVPILIGVSILLLVAAGDGSLGWGESVFFLAGGIGYTVWTIRASRAASLESGQPRAPAREMVVPALLVLAGLGLLVIGARLLVDGAVDLAGRLGVSELVIGLTIVAAGTSLPEVATSLVAAVRGERDIAVGNVVGSNIFNILFVLGAAGSVTTAPIPVAESVIRFDLIVMIAVAIACLPVMLLGRNISRLEGLLFFAYYVLYTVDLVLAARGSDVSTSLRQAMLVFLLPLAAITLLVILRRPRSGA